MTKIWEMFQGKKKEETGLYSTKNVIDEQKNKTIIMVAVVAVIVVVFLFLIGNSNSNKGNGISKQVALNGNVIPKANISFTKNQLLEEQRLYEAQNDAQLEGVKSNTIAIQENLEKTTEELSKTKEDLEAQKKKAEEAAKKKPVSKPVVDTEPKLKPQKELGK